MHKFLRRLLPFLFFYLPLHTLSQTKMIEGEVLDKQSDEPIPFASIRLLLQGSGQLTDSLGRFSLPVNNKSLKDTVQITSVG